MPGAVAQATPSTAPSLHVRADGGLLTLITVRRCAGYSIYGTSIDTSKPITSVLSKDAWSVAMNAGLFIHCIIAYQINVNVWSSSLLHVLRPQVRMSLWISFQLVVIMPRPLIAGLLNALAIRFGHPSCNAKATDRWFAQCFTQCLSSLFPVISKPLLIAGLLNAV